MLSSWSSATRRRWSSFFFYFGLGTMLPAVETAGMRVPLLNNVAWAIISLSLFAAAFNVEIFRSGIEAVPRTTIEAAEALGYTRFKAYFISCFRWRSASVCQR